MEETKALSLLMYAASVGKAKVKVQFCCFDNTGYMGIFAAFKEHLSVPKASD